MTYTKTVVNTLPTLSNLRYNIPSGETIIYPDSTLLFLWDCIDPDIPAQSLSYDFKLSRTSPNPQTILEVPGLEVNQKEVILSAFASFGIEPGDQMEIEIKAKDDYGTTIKNMPFVIEGDYPSISINEPLAGSIYSSTPPHIDVDVLASVDIDYVGWTFARTTTTDPSLLSFTELTDPYSADVSQSEWDSIDTLLEQGQINLWIKCEDINSKISYKSNTLIKDTSPPIISIISPTNPYQDETAGVYLNIKEDTFDHMTIYLSSNPSTILWDDTMILYDFVNDPYFESPIFIDTISNMFSNDFGYDVAVPFSEDVWLSLGEGTHDLTVEITDLAGHISTSNIQITQDTSNPQDVAVNFAVNEQDNIFYFNRDAPDFTISFSDELLLRPLYYSAIIEVFEADESFVSIDPENPILCFEAFPTETGDDFVQTIFSTNFDTSQSALWESNWAQIFERSENNEIYIILNITVLDNAGNCNWTLINGFFDPIDPDSLIDVPTISGSPPTIQYTINDLSATIMYGIGEVVYIIGSGESNGEFTINSGLWELQEEGEVSVRIWAEDLSLNSIYYYETIIKDTIPPEVIASYSTIYFSSDPPEIQFRIMEDAVSFTGTITKPDNQIDTLEIELESLPIENGYYVINLQADPTDWASFIEGEYLMEMVAVDAAGNHYDFDLIFYKDVTPCTILDISTIGGPYHGVSAPLVEIQVDEATSLIEYSYDGVYWFSLNLITPALDQWSAQFDGTINIQFRAYDLATNPSEIRTLSVHKDSIIPIFTIDEDLYGGKFGSVAPNVEIIAMDLNLASIYYYYDESDDDTFNVAFTGAQFMDTISLLGWNELGHGTHSITFITTDGGNDVILTASFEKDIMGPEITIISPVLNKNYSNIAPLYALEIPDEDLVSMWYVIDDSEEISISSFSGTLDQYAWENPPSNYTTITFYAQDDLGNINSVSITIYREDYGVYIRDTGFGGIFEHWMMPQWVVFGMTVGIVVIVMYPKYKAKKLEGVEVLA